MERSVPYRPLIRDMPREERPRERLRAHGAGALSTAELLAILLRVGSARESVLALASRLLAKYQGLPGLARASFDDLAGEHGIGVAKASQVKAALELGRRLLTAAPEDRPFVGTPQEVATLVSGELAFLEQEHLRVILLTTRNQVVAISEVSQGTVNTSLVRVAEVFREAIRRNCPALIVVHNHPSGDPTPSEDDIALTRTLVEAGKLLEVEVLDHVIIGQGRFLSLRERKLGFA